jgi:hypothetical protein
MSSPGTVLQRPGSMGWMVLNSGQLEFEVGRTIVQRLLELIDQERNLLLLEMELPSLKAIDFPQSMAELTGQDLLRMVAAASNADPIRQAWLNAGLIFAVGGSLQSWKEFIGIHLFQGYPEEVLADGSILVMSGSSAGALGTWMFDESNDGLLPGLGWLEGGLILPGVSEPAANPAVFELLEDSTPAYALGLPGESILALGPVGEVEVWSSPPPVILLGRGWLSTENGA